MNAMRRIRHDMVLRFLQCPMGGMVRVSELDSIMPRALRNLIPAMQALLFLEQDRGVHFVPVSGPVYGNRTAAIAAFRRVPEKVAPWRMLILGRVSEGALDRALRALAVDLAPAVPELEAAPPRPAEDPAAAPSGAAHQDVPNYQVILVELAVATVQAWTPILQRHGLQ